MLDNHIYQGNELNIDPKRVLWRRVVDMNDRQLRNIIDGMGKPVDGVMRPDGFDITVASEDGSILLRQRHQRFKRAFGQHPCRLCQRRQPCLRQRFKANGAMAALFKDAIGPNLVQTIEGTRPLHGGPFANIAHGCNSCNRYPFGETPADYAVTEAGFGADLGAEKILRHQMPSGDLKPDAAVVVATVRALKYNGGVERANLGEETSKPWQRPA